MARILLTGASGLLGINFVMAHKDHHDITAVVNSRPFQVEGVDVVTADLLADGALEQVFDTAQPDWVVHAAAMANIDECEREPERARAMNTDLPRAVARLAHQAGARLVLISTDAVFDGARPGYTEDDKPVPINEYGRTKLAGEQTALAEHSEALIARVNFYGWSRSGRRSIGEFFHNNLAAGQPMKGVADSFFSTLLATDLADILVAMLAHDLSGVYHVYASDSISKYDFGVRIAQLFGYDSGLIEPVSINDIALDAPRSPDLRLNADKLSQALSITLPDITAGLVRWYEQYQSGYPAELQAL